MSDQPGLIGARVTRVEDERLITGASRYIDDLQRPGMLHLRFVRSPFASAEIVGQPEFDDSAIGGEQPLLFTGEDFNLGLRSDIRLDGWRTSVYPPMARGVVRYAGEPVAAVLHPDPYVAEDLAETVHFDFEPRVAVASVEQALRTDAPKVHDDWDRNIFISRRQSFGDIDQARREADVVVRRVFRNARQAGVPLECRGMLAEPDGRGGVVLWASTQIPHLVRSVVAEQLNLPETSVRVIAPDVGGGFGVKGHVYPDEALVAALALKLDRPVKWIEDRREHLLSSIHAREHVHIVEAYVRNDGRVLGVKAQFLVDAGSYSVYPWTAGSDAGMLAKVMLGPYDVKHYQTDSHAVATNKCPLGTYRGVARPGAVFSMERLMDDIATEVHLDPFEIRRRNVVTEFPHETTNNLILDSGDYREAVDRMQRMVEEVFVPSDDPRIKRGFGIALYNEQTAQGTPDFEKRKVPIGAGYESALVEMDPQGRVTVHTGLQSHGQGLETTLAQVAATELGVALDHVRVIHGDSNAPYALGTWGSRGATLGGGAVAKASRQIRIKLIEIAAHNLEVSKDDLEVDDGRVSVKGSNEMGYEIAELAGWAVARPAFLPSGMDPGLTAQSVVDGPATGSFSYSCHGAVVSIDTTTGKVKLDKYLVVEDCGTMINPMIVDGQVHGGVAQGIGSALLEEFQYGPDGQPLSATFMDYLMPTSVDVPDIMVDHMITPSPFTPHGMKGMGEAGAIGPMAAVANAVTNALGVGANHTPLRMGRMWSLLQGEDKTSEFENLLGELGLTDFWSE